MRSTDEGRRGRGASQLLIFDWLKWMATNPPITESVTKRTRAGWLRRHKRLVWSVCAAVGVALIIGGYFAEQYWPYRYRNVKPMLESVFASKVTFSGYYRTYFPHVGFVAKGVTMRRHTEKGLAPIGSAEEMVVQGSWVDLLTLKKRVRRVDVTGLHVVIPALGSNAMQQDFPMGSAMDFAGPSMTVEELLIHRSVVDLMKADGGKYTYPIEQASIRNLRAGQAFTFALEVENAIPAGQVEAKGSFGPVMPKNLGATPVHGTFTLEQGDLSEIGELQGKLAAAGSFHGTVTSIAVQTTAETPDFRVNNGRPAQVSWTAHLTVNGLNSDMVLNSVEARTGESLVEAQGKMAGTPKVTDVDFSSTKGRAEDLLRPFLEKQSPITGVVWLKAHAHLAAGGANFLNRLTVTGEFDVPQEKVTNPAIEQKLTTFSERAQGGKAAKGEKEEAQTGAGPATTDVLSGLEGKAQIVDGVASSKRLTFDMPGAKATMAGWYNLSSGQVHMDGTLKTKADISKTQTGFKSWLLKPLAPFFKKKKVGAVIPIAVTGRPNHYQVSSNMLHQK